MSLPQPPAFATRTALRWLSAVVLIALTGTPARALPHPPAPPTALARGSELTLGESAILSPSSRARERGTGEVNLSPARQSGPGGEVKRRRGRKVNPARIVDTPATRRAARLGLGTRPAAAQLLAGRAERAWIAAAGGADPLPGTLKMPVARGWFLRGFGSGKAGYHQAIDIGGLVGWNVRAAAPGIVGYAGDEVSGYGNMVLVIHPGGWVTLYAHNDKNLVSAGQRVDRGTVIAALGSTGLSKGPHVHFELLHGGENCDPAPLFRPAMRHRNGRTVKVDALSWRSPRKRPQGIACYPRRHHPDHLGKAEPEALDEGTEDASPGSNGAGADGAP